MGATSNITKANTSDAIEVIASRGVSGISAKAGKSRVAPRREAGATIVENRVSSRRVEASSADTATGKARVARREGRSTILGRARAEAGKQHQDLHLLMFKLQTEVPMYSA